MAYEYEDKLRNYLIGHKNVNPKFDGFEILQSVDELKEVYRKAKAWEQFKEEKMNDYITWSNAEKRSDLIRMDKLDGTNEFRNLLSDLEDKQND